AGVVPETRLVGIEPTDDEITRAAELASACDATVLFLFDAHLYASNARLLTELQTRARALAVVLLRDPYDAALLAPEVLGITAFGTSGAGRFDRFYDFAGAPAEIAIERPFYPRRGIKGTTRDHLRAALGDAAFTPRACDRQAGAGPIFWLVGPRQVGRSAACVWREILTPRLDRLALWPFDGTLAELIGA